MINKSLKILFALALGALIIWLSVRRLSPTDKEEITQAFRQANYWWMLLSLLVAFISNISRSIRWQMLLKPLGYKPKFINVMLSVLVAYFANLGLPRLGEVVRCGLLRTHEKIPFEKSFGTVVTERVLDLIIFAILFIINFVVQFQALHQYVEDEIFSQFSFSLSTSIYIVLAIGCVTLGILYFFRDTVKNNPIYLKIKTVLLGFWSGIKSIRQIDKPGRFIFHSLFIWFCYWLMSYLIFQSLPITQSLSPLVALSTLTIGTIGMILVQGGLGLYPLLVAGVLVIYNISYPVGYAMGWLIWGGQTLGIIIAGILALILIPILNKKGN